MWTRPACPPSKQRRAADAEPERCRCQGGVRLMDGIISRTDESVEGGGARGHPDTPTPHPQSHAIVPPADIHHPARAWWIVGDHWSEKIPLNSGHSIWCVTVNSAHGNCERPRSAAPAAVHPSPARTPHDALREMTAERFSTCFLICAVSFAQLHFQSEVQFSFQSLPAADNLLFILHPLFHKYLYVSRRKHTHALTQALQPEIQSAA